MDDLYALSLLFPEGAYPGLHIVTQVIGGKVGLLDRVENDEHTETYLTGDGCSPLIERWGHQDLEWLAVELLAPLNGYAVLSDSNFQPVVPIGASYIASRGDSGFATFEPNIPNRPTRAITTNRHHLLKDLLPTRVAFMSENLLATQAAAIIAEPPSWADYYRLLEDIAGHRGTTLDKLAETGLATPQALKAFKMAANNRASGRHGTSKRNTGLLQNELMNLLEAREFVRTVVSAWLDLECGGRLPRDRVDGGPLRFGLDGSC